MFRLFVLIVELAKTVASLVSSFEVRRFPRVVEFGNFKVCHARKVCSIFSLTWRTFLRTG